MSGIFLFAGTASLLVYSAILLLFLRGVARTRKRQSTRRRPTVSVVLAARNEEGNLLKCLTAVTTQRYPTELTEFVIVNDRSTDATAKILQSFELNSPSVRSIHVTETPGNSVSPKKFALSQAIASTSGELIFTTDADCCPPPNWISGMVPLFREEVGIVCGAAPFESRRSFWTRLLCLDNLAAAFVSAGAAGWNMGVTCTGRNLAYRREVFEQVNGFTAINHSLSGDDDLFLQQVKRLTDWGVEYTLDPRIAVPSPAPAGLSSFLRQRRRHTSAGKYYSRGTQLGYLIFNVANVTLFTFFAFACFETNLLRAAIALLTAKTCLDFIALLQMASRLEQTKLLWLFPIWEIFFLVNQVFVAPLGFVGKVKWR